MLPKNILFMTMVAALLFACGSDESSGNGKDAGTVDSGVVADAAPPDAEVPADAAPLDVEACPENYGPASILSSFLASEDEDVGKDFDGDDEVDNSIVPLATIANQQFNNAIQDGSLLTLSELRDFDPDESGNDSDVSVVLYGGVDSDTPANHLDNFSGEETFYYDPGWVEGPMCLAKALVKGSFKDGALDAYEPEKTISFYVAALGGFLDVLSPYIYAEVVPDTKGYKTEATRGIFSGIIRQCALARYSIDFGNVQALMTQLGVQPDIDLDGDGLETVENSTLAFGPDECKDGDGTLILSTEEVPCSCDPRIQDGYSFTFTFTLVGAEILGVNK